MILRLPAALVLVLASNALAASPLTLDFTKNGDRPSYRTKALLKSRSTVDATLRNYESLEYIANMTVGTPPQHLGIQLDTGSSNFWVPSTKAPVCADSGCIFGAYNANKSTTSTYVDSNFYMEYYDPSDYDAGDYITDTVSIAGATLQNLSIGVAYDGVDAIGVLGISFTFAEEGDYDPTLIDLLKSQGQIDRKAYSMYLNDITTNTGSIIFGGIDTTKYTGPLVSLPMQPDGYSNVTDLSVALTSVHMTDALGTHKVSHDNFTAVPAVLDSGTWDMELPAPIANAIIAGMGAVYTEDEGYVVPCHYGDNANATFIFGFGGPDGVNISVPIKQMLTDATFAFKNGEEACSLGIDPVDLDLGGEVLLGDTFLRSAYVVYDLENLEIALAQAKYGVQEKNVVNIPSGKGLPGVTKTATVGVPTATAASGDNTLLPATPTYDLGSGAGAPTATANSGPRKLSGMGTRAVAGAVALGLLGVV